MPGAYEPSSLFGGDASWPGSGPVFSQAPRSTSVARSRPTVHLQMWGCLTSTCRVRAAPSSTPGTQRRPLRASGGRCGPVSCVVCPLEWWALWAPLPQAQPDPDTPTTLRSFPIKLETKPLPPLPAPGTGWGPSTGSRQAAPLTPRGRSQTKARLTTRAQRDFN